MYKDVLRAIEGIGIYPTLSFTLFFVFFIALTTYVVFADKSKIQKIKQIPLEDKELY